MRENFDTNNMFVFPSYENEKGEIRRVAELFSPNDPNEFIRLFLERYSLAKLIYLTDDIWSKLDNTDSFDILEGDWEAVEDAALENDRDYMKFRKAIESGRPLPAPIIVKVGERYHKVAGNTRLMVARALGITPQALLVDMGK